MTSPTSPVDVLILGSGPAGLSCASALARLVHPCIIFTTNTYRNEKSPHMHVVPTWDHRNPKDFIAASKKDLLARYSDVVRFEEVGIEGIEKVEGKEEEGETLFKATDEKGGEWWGKKVVIASGITDIMPNIEGYQEN